jgi:hypothetical protein
LQDSGKGTHNEMSSSTVARGPLCRVLLSNGSTTVVPIKSSETIQQLVARLLDKRGLMYSAFEVYTDKHPKVCSFLFLRGANNFTRNHFIYFLFKISTGHRLYL